MSDRQQLEENDPKFELGQCVITPGAIVVLEFNGISPTDLLRRHVTGDDGDLDEEDKAANRAAIQTGDRILSAYSLAGGERVWIITYPGDNTCILLPSEY